MFLILPTKKISFEISFATLLHIFSRQKNTFAIQNCAVWKDEQSGRLAGICCYSSKEKR
jgi:hypothetical protein